MLRSRLLLFAVLVLLVSGCASPMTKDIKVDAQADPKANFGGYKSYAWLATAEIVNDPYGRWEPPQFDADAEIKYLLDRELRKRGMVESASSPDLFIAFAAGIDMAALGLKEDPETKKEILTNVPQGGLLVAFVDSQTGFVIWRGVATAEVLDKPDTETIRNRLDHAVTQLIKQVPR